MINMDHVAIMKKEWGLIPKILKGEKKLESRWYSNRSKPWDKIAKGDMVYFKNSGEPVTIKAQVSKVLQYSALNPQTVRELLWKYAEDDGLGIDEKELEKFYMLFRNKRYAMFIYLHDPQKIARPFQIDKTGFGAMSAWITIDEITKIKMEQNGKIYRAEI